VSDTLVSLADISAAARRMAGTVRRTPLLDVPADRGPLWLKCENLQPMGAFKLRGATNMLLPRGLSAPTPSSPFPKQSRR